MIAHPHWINRQIAIVPRPQGEDRLDDEMQALRHAGIDVVVSMLEEDEAVELGLRRERSAAEEAKIIFVNFSVPDRSVPLDHDVYVQFLAEIEAHLAAGRRIGIHCRACIGRSSVVAASLLIRSGVSAKDAWTQVAVARGFPVPDTKEQLSWVNRYIGEKPS